MFTPKALRLFSKTALLAALLATAGCENMENPFDRTDTSPKVEVKSPAAAPVQDVKADEIKPAEELGSISAPPIDNNDKIVPSAPQEVQKQAEPAPVAANSVALLTVRFNQPHVYYDDALTSAVQAAEAAKSGVMYDVLSTVPDLTSLPADQQTKLAGRAKDNLRNVVTKMQTLGVSSDRIRIAEQTLKIRSQEIQIYVR